MVYTIMQSGNIIKIAAHTPKFTAYVLFVSVPICILMIFPSIFKGVTLILIAPASGPEVQLLLAF